MLHHRFGGEPYGFLLPVVPAHVRERARAATATAADPDPATWLANRT